VTAVDNVTDYWPRGRLGIRWGLFNPFFDVRQVNILRESVGTFDVVACISTFEHVIDRRGLFASMAAAVAPGGTLLLTTPYREDGGVSNAYELPDSDAYGLQLPYGCRVLDRDELESLSGASDLEISDLQYWCFYEGRYWSEGRQLPRGVRVGPTDNHQIACISLEHKD
jgi:SAM-dependent methyltransferase